MTTPFTERYKLFKTVKDLHAQGKAELTASEQNQIEYQTMDLVRKSILTRQASIVPEGFEMVLRKLQTVDTQEAYDLLVDFLKMEGAIEGPDLGDKPGRGPMDGLDDKPDFDDKPGRGPMDGPPKIDKGPPKSPLRPDDKPEMGSKPREDKTKKFLKEDIMKEGKTAEEEKKEEKSEKNDDDKDKSSKEEKEKKEEKEAVLKKAQEQEHKPIVDLQKKEKEKGSEISIEEMGVEENPNTEGAGVTLPEPTPSFASKVRVGITENNTLLAQHNDHGLVFHAVPKEDIRADKKAIRKLAIDLYHMIVEEGFAKAAKDCNAKMLITAGVDDDIELDNIMDVPPEKEPVTSDAESDTKDDRDDDSDSVLPKGEVDTKEKPEVVTARRKAVLRAANLKYQRRQGKDILDEAENVMADADKKPSKPSMDSTSDADTDAQEQHVTPEGNVLTDADQDFKTAQKNFSTLYKRRMAKEKETFIRKFNKALRIAATRMALNHEEHPFKIAAVDVLAAEAGEIEFTHGDVYGGMDIQAAVELTELIISEGHEPFLKALLANAADLMEKSDEYLADTEVDIRNLAPTPIGQVYASMQKVSSKKRSSKIRRDAAEGNFEIGNGAIASGSENLLNRASFSDAVSGSTAVGRKLGRLQRKR